MVTTTSTSSSTAGQDSQVRTLTFREALREAMREEMLRDERVFLIGEEIGVYGGAFQITKGLWEEFGSSRVVDTPISESAITGAAVGAALMGMKPVAEIMFADFISIAMDQLVGNAAKMIYIHGPGTTLPMVVRAAYGAGTRSGIHHSMSPENWLTHVPGIKVVMPANPYDAKGLLKSAIRDPNPVVFFEQKLLYAVKGPVPAEDYTIPLGKAEIKRQGKDVTIIATGFMVGRALKAADQLASDGISAEVVDPRTLAPLDKDTIVNSVIKTGRAVIVHEAPVTSGFGGEIAAVLAKEAFGYLDAPIERVCGPDIHVPFSPVLEDAFLVKEDAIVAAAKTTLS